MNNKEKKINMKKWTMLLAIIVMFCLVSPAQGHMLWLNASNYSPRIGESITIEIGFGHKYPHTEAVREESVESVLISDNKGKEWPIERIAPGRYTFTPEAGGRYDVIVILKPGFVSNTTEGRKMGSKKTLTNVVSCFGFSMNAKALINVGSMGSSSPSPHSTLPLEILLPEKIHQVNAGDELALKVLYQGKPVGGAKVSAVDENTASQEEGKWIQESESDNDGMVHMKLTAKGKWLITASYELPYPDQTECDKSSYRTAVTFGL